MRLHGSRCRHHEPTPGLLEPSGDPNEIWSFGERNFEIIKKILLIREKLRPYIQKQFDTASEKGYPVIRPIFFHHPDNEICYSLESQYFFGDDIIFAPIVNKGQTEKEVYLPDDEWILAKDGKIYSKGWHTVKADIDEFIAFVRKGTNLKKCFE